MNDFYSTMQVILREFHNQVLSIRFCSLFTLRASDLTIEWEALSSRTCIDLLNYDNLLERPHINMLLDNCGVKYCEGQEYKSLQSAQKYCYTSFSSLIKSKYRQHKAGISNAKIDRSLPKSWLEEGRHRGKNPP